MVLMRPRNFNGHLGSIRYRKSSNFEWVLDQLLCNKSDFVQENEFLCHK